MMRPEWEYHQSREEYQPRTEKISLAYRVAEIAHEGQRRVGGSEYINHPVAVASLIEDVFGVDDENTLVAALLHDTVEDCANAGPEKLEKLSVLLGRIVTKIDLRLISETFGEEVAFLVDGVTKFGDDAETIRKVILSTEINWKVILIKLGDRCHNLSTIESMPEEKQRNKARETLDIYTHMAESVGMWSVKNYLEDESFKYSDPEKYWEIRNIIDHDPRLNQQKITEMTASLSNWLEAHKFSGKVEVRVKGYYEAMKKREKMIREGRCFHPDDFSDLADLVSYRLVLSDLDQVELAHARLKAENKDVILADRADDYITEESGNGYSAYHESLRIGGMSTEIAIMTADKEDFNNWGLVSLWQRGERNLSDYVQIMVFLRNGEMRFLRKGATGIDLAALISPRVLAYGAGILIDGSEVLPMETVLPNAVSVTIETGETKTVRQDWLAYCETPLASKEVAKQLGLINAKETRDKGRKMMEEIVKERGLFSIEDLDEKTFYAIVDELEVDRKVTKVYAALGGGGLSREYVEEILDNHGVAKVNEQGLRTSSLRVRGEDIPWTIALLTNWIAGQGGSLTKTINQVDEGSYEARLVMKGISEKNEKELLKWMEGDKDGRFTQIELV